MHTAAGPVSSEHAALSLLQPLRISFGKLRSCLTPSSALVGMILFSPRLGVPPVRVESLGGVMTYTYLVFVKNPD